MGVSRETAEKWESAAPKYDPDSSPNSRHPPFEVKRLVAEHFVTARTKSWSARRGEYWQWLKQKAADERQYDVEYDNNLVRWGYAHHRDPALVAKVHPGGVVGTNDEHGIPNSEREAWMLRAVIGMHRQERIGDEFHGFMDLPREVRDMVYGHALVRGQVWVPNDDGRIAHWRNDAGAPYRRYEGMCLDLVDETGGTPHARRNPEHGHKPLGLIGGVSRAVHTEATEMFFGRNQIILPAGHFSYPRYFNLRVPAAESATDFVEVRRYWNYAALARDVSYTFDMRDHGTRDGNHFWDNNAVRDRVDDGSLSPRQALHMLHDEKVFWLEVDWAERIDSIKQMTLDRLQLSFDECYCPLGCCRKVDWVLDRFLHDGPLPGHPEEHVWSSVDWKSGPPDVIQVMGLVHDREKAMVREKLGRLTSRSHPIGLVL